MKWLMRAQLPLTDEDADFIGNVHLYKASHVQKLKQMLDAQLLML
jgi:hypothetical protein